MPDIRFLYVLSAYDVRNEALMAGITLEKKQEAIVTTLDGPLFVSAGAGSGKTFTLTQRVMYALRPGSKPRGEWADPACPEPFLESIDQVLAITFTEKAAQELKERIRSALLDEGMDEQAARVDDSWISTIHGMCSRIIRAHALDLGIDPAFGILQAPEELKRRAVERVLRRVVTDDRNGAGAYDALLSAFPVESAGAGSHDVDNLLAMLSALLAKTSSAIGGIECMKPIMPKPSHIELFEAYCAIADAPSYANAEAAASSLRALEEYLASGRTLDDLRACRAGCDKLSLRGKGMGKDEKAAVEDVRAALPAFFSEAYLACRADALEQIAPLASEVEEEYRRLKAERSLLDNDDLLTLAYDALKDNPLVREEFSGKFKMVMVDEFQDTAQQQVELVRMLCSPDGRELCTVGDAQQSIYRFRGADVSVFRNKKQEVEATGGSVLSLDTNYRSHADILSFADKVFEGGAENPLGRDFLHLVSCGEDRRGRARAMHGPRTSRRQALLVVGGTSDERAAQKARGIAERFARLREEEGFEPGDMVILMTKLTRAETYASAVRAVGLPCVVAGGTSVFRNAPEVGVIKALLAFLANPDDGQDAALPLLTSPMFELGAQELLALSTCIDAPTGVVDSRSLTADVILHGELMEQFGELPLIVRMREVLCRALARVGRDRVSDIVRDCVNESGWLLRLEHGGAQDQAVAANVLKALDIVSLEEEGRAYAPRLVARAFADHIETVKESPATLNGSGAQAVRIMTVHASKGLEFPVVAIAECDGIKANKDRFRMIDRDGMTLWTAFPNRFDRQSDGAMLEAPELEEDTLALPMPPARAAEAYSYMGRESSVLDYEEAARLLYVAVTRAREVVILAMGARYGTELVAGHRQSLLGEVLSRILPPDAGNNGLPDLSSDRLDFPDSLSGDFRMVLLADLKYPKGDKKTPYRLFEMGDFPGFEDEAGSEPRADLSQGEGRTVELVRPRGAEYSSATADGAPRISYSYSSLSRDLHAAERAGAGAGAAVADGPAVEATAARGGDPTALGSAFHAAAQWMVEMGCDDVPAERRDALASYWGCTPEQRVRLDEALARWTASPLRLEALSWPCVRAEVPFFSMGDERFTAEHGGYAEGSIDLLCTDPGDRGHALVIDYKTGGSEDETSEQLHEKHRLQAEVYAQALHRDGYGSISLRFVRVEVPDAADPALPQVVSFEL